MFLPFLLTRYVIYVNMAELSAQRTRHVLQESILLGFIRHKALEVGLKNHTNLSALSFALGINAHRN